ncbi:kinesin-like protein [Ceratocystis pirilliformis]|uniref:Kinesin-like protein n=1 Tax=Ceratocystis pirilliformis TaxID=259994 RepID=A0ABR3Z9C2_9PEZI
MPNLTSSFASAAAGQNQNARDSRGIPGDRGSSSDWNRRDGRSFNGTRTFRRSTTTTPSGQSISSNASAQSPNPNPISSSSTFPVSGSGIDQSSNLQSITTNPPGVPYSMANFEQNSTIPARYGKNQILEIFCDSSPQLSFPTDVASSLYMDGWAPGQAATTDAQPSAQSNGSAAASSGVRQWGKPSDNSANQEPDMCWMPSQPDFKPLGLQDFTAEEKEAFTNDVNSPLKLMTSNANNGPNANKDGHSHAQGTGANGRKNVTHSNSNQPSNTFGLNLGHSSGLTSPTSTSNSSRPSVRRRESGDQYGSLNSPQTSRFPRDDNTSWIGNRNKMSELRESSTLESDDNSENTPIPQSSRDPPKGGLFGTVGGSSKLPASASGGGPFMIGVTTSGSTTGWPSTASGQNTPSMGSFGNFALPGAPPVGPIGGAKSSVAAAGARESRLAHLIPGKDSESSGSSNTQSKTATAAVDGNLEQGRSWRRPRTDTDPFSDPGRMGTSLLSGSQGDSPPMPSRSANMPFETPTKSGGGVGTGVGDMGMSSLSLGQGGHDNDGQDQFSPSATNPYRSPAGGDRDRAEEQGHLQHRQDEAHSNGNIGMDRQIGGIIGSTGADQNSSGYGGPRPFGGNPIFDGSDRSQTSSAGPKTYTGLGAIGGWPGSATVPNVGTPDRERGGGFGNAFGSSIFPSIGGDIPTSGFGGSVFGPPSNGPGAIGAPSIGRRSKLEALFPISMQTQMQPPDHEESEMRQGNLGPIGRGGFPTIGRDTDSPMRTSNRGFDELFPPPGPPGSAHPLYGGHDISAPGTGPVAGTQATTQSTTFNGLPSTGAERQGTSSTGPSRQMVMPDRMRWVYLDPQGQVQGPFTGLEMNDWYKANFFSPDLSVKRVEDPEFEPLGSLIRRIGNSREPFLVPQIGIPHGPPTQSSHFGQTPTGGVVPPLSSVIPAYGRTLTAEEQNNLERRKQEEQFVAAQQRDFLMRQQAMAPKFPYGTAVGVPGLQHHSSAHSLHSQPGFGTMGPLGAGVHQPIAAGFPQFFDGHLGPGMPQVMSGPREGEIPGMSELDRQVSAFGGHPGASGGANHGTAPGELGGLFNSQGALNSAAELDGSGLRDSLPATNSLVQDEEGFKDRIQEFERLRQDVNADLDQQHIIEEEQQQHQQTYHEDSNREEYEPASDAHRSPNVAAEAERETEAEVEDVDVVRAAAEFKEATETKNSVAASAPSASPFDDQNSSYNKALTSDVSIAGESESKNENFAEYDSQQEEYARFFEFSQTGPQGSDLPMPFPPPPGAASPTLSSPTPMQPPPLAPWAREANESRKGPSLKEIQEAEAAKAAKADQAAAAARRAALEQEVADTRERERAMASMQTGLPTTSTWGQASASPAATVSSPWVRPATRSGSSISTPAQKQKTLAEIQREEELRKAKAAKESASMTPVAGSAGSVTGSTGKRYADLASKGAPSSAISSSILSGSGGATSSSTSISNPAAATTVVGGWATVGAGGRVKTPAAPTTAGPSRAISTATPKPTTSKPTILAKSGTTTAKSDAAAAQDEFNKWLMRELRGLSDGIDASTFAATLILLPLDSTLISDAVYASSATIDGRHFAEEFIRRKKLADKGIVEKNGTSNSGTTGWSEVAKKNSTVREQSVESSMSGAGFKVVPGRKKTGKK